MRFSTTPVPPSPLTLLQPTLHPTQRSSAALAALFCLCSCTEKQHTTDPETPNLPVGFRPMSQAVWVKSGTDSNTPTFTDDKFKVWGIARDSRIPATYNLWNNTFTEVNRKVTDTGERTNQFIPNGDEYWIYGYTYDFLAFAPYDAIPVNAISVVQANAQNNALGKDYMTFTYDLSAKYAVDKNDFDLLGAAAQTVNDQGGRKANQDLLFWHLLSQVKFDIGFGKDATGAQINGVIDEIRLSPIPSATYKITYDNSTDNPTAPTGIICDQATTTNSKPVLTFNPKSSTAQLDYISIVPQSASDLTFEIDFTIKESTTSTAEYKGLVFNLSIPNKLEEYEPNGRYSYEMTIGSKAGITFSVSVNNWGDTVTSNPIEM